MNQNQAKTTLNQFLQALDRRRNGIDCVGPTGSAAAFVAASAFLKNRLPVCVIAASAGSAERLLDDLRFFLPPEAPPPIYFPAYNILPFKFMSYHNQTAARRIATLYRLMVHDSPFMLVTTIDAILQRIIPRDRLTGYAELIMVGEEVDRDQLAGTLLSGGYTHTTIVEEAGDFCVRGGIVDVYSPLYDNPLRIELFGDTVEALRTFSATTQRTVQSIDEAVILPAKEAVIARDELPTLINCIRERAADLNLPVSDTRHIVKRLKSESDTSEIESLTPLLYRKMDTLFDYTSDKTLFIQMEPEALAAAAVELEARAVRNVEEAKQKRRLCVEPEQLYLSWEAARRFLARARSIRMKNLAVIKSKVDDPAAYVTCQLKVADNAWVRGELQRSLPSEQPFLPLSRWITEQRQAGCMVMLVCRTRSQAQRLESLLLSYGIKLQRTRSSPTVERLPGEATITFGQLSAGFTWTDQSLAIITEEEIFGSRTGRRRRVRSKPAAEFLAFEDLHKGDFIVHVEHGIGVYAGLAKLKLNGTTNDFLLLTYRDNDKLYLPVDRMNMVQKYMGVDGIQPLLDKMGGTTWGRTKDRIKKSAAKIAGQLLKLYAARQVKKGFKFDDLGSDLQDFEAGFPYAETADQIQAIDDVLQDMSNQRPMDRLVCGDVGYGKTEVAMRAAFVAVYNGKQVAVLVPTTVLAEQHFGTFSDRFARYPIRLACLTRFRTKKEQRAIVADLKSGKIDIVIGTHRLLSSDIGFKDLGLIILDEEQRFGVKHKEKLKTFRRTVDVLALTATPIPRTLHMSLMGIRDISVIATPPELRQAIITYICEFDDDIASEAIRRELKRSGQIFFIHNNIQSIPKMARKLQALVPEVRLDIAHGQLHEEMLERVMMRFINREIDMLICTTIVESGLDIPSANTMLVNRADRFGLAQMYQLRGRVGRSDEQAYAYLFIPHESLLTKYAQKRLKVLMEHSDLGAGFQIAMSDLQIRGGGSILGASQSGHIAAVGYDMFLKLMENAVAEMKGEKVVEPLAPEININLSAYLPETYIPDIDQRLSAYRQLARMTEPEEINEYKAELIDRYGPLPDEVRNLLLKIMLKVLSISAGVQRLDISGGRLLLNLSPTHQQRPEAMVDMIMADKGRFELTPDHLLKVNLVVNGDKGRFVQIKNVLKELAQRVNS